MQSKSRRKSLLYLAVYDPHVPLTGTGMRGAEFVNNLAEHFDLDLIYIDGSGQPPIPELSLKYSSKIKGVRSKIVINFSQFRYFIFSSTFYKQAVNLIKKYKHDFILCDYGLSSVYGILLLKKFNIPFIYCSHNIEYRGYLDKAKKDFRRLFLAPYVYWVEKTGVKQSTILVPITRSDAEYYTLWTNREKMVLVPQGFDEKIFNPFYDPPNNSPKTVLFCGNYNIQFNRDVVDIVMEFILDKVLSVCPNTRFYFLGANPPKNINHPNVEFTGFVEDYPAHLKKADVVISPMRGGWGSPTKIFEALACGKTVIATPIGARSLESDYETLHVCEISEFPEMICKALKSGKSLSEKDFEKLNRRYAWRGTIKSLIKKIETIS